VSTPAVDNSEELKTLKSQNERLEAKIRQMREDNKSIRAELSSAQTLLAAKDSVLAERNSELAEKDSAARASEAEYENRIQLLSEEIKRLPPTARLAADAQAAVYALMQEEAEELAAAIEAENREAEALRLYRQKRTERLIARRQEILKRLGTDAEDMTRRALLAHPDDPRTTHLRQELDALRLLQEKTALDSEQKIRDLTTKLRECEMELKRRESQQNDIATVYRQLQETREKLQRREKELMEERQKGEEERQQHAAAQQALLTRLSALEMGLPGATHQSREARSVRLAPWMGLKT
jgi:chromosome segregation ATPase